MAEIEIKDSDQGFLEVEMAPEEDQSPEIPEIGRTAGIVALDQGKDPVGAYMSAIQSGDIEGMITNFQSTVKEDRTEMMNSFVGINPPEVIEKDARDLYTDLSPQGGVLGPMVQKIKSMPSSVGKSDEQIRQVALSTLQRQSLASFRPSSLSEGAGDFFGVLLPKRKAFTVRAVSDALGFTEGVSDDISILFDPTENLNKMRNLGKQLEGEDKARYIVDIQHAVDKASDNNFIKSDIMNAIFGEGEGEADKLFELLDLAAVGELANVVLKTGKAAYKVGSGLNTARRLNSPDLAAEIITKAGVDEGATNALGVTKAEVGDSLNPLVKDEIADMLEGAPSDMAAQITHMLDLQDARYAVAVNLSREGVLDRETVEIAMRAAEIEQLKKPGVVGAKVIKSDETGFTLEWSTARFDEAGNPITYQTGDPALTKQTKQIDFTLDQVGKISSPMDEYIRGFTRRDPNARMKGKLRNWFVSIPERLARSQEKTAFGFDNMMKDAFASSGKRLKAKEAAKVDHALIQGAKEGKVYNYTDLTVSGIGANSVKLSPREAQAYFGVRNVVNHIYDLKNKQIVDNYIATGVKLIDDVEGAIPARTFDSAQDAMRGWKSLKSDSLWINISDDGLRTGDVPITTLKFENKAALTEDILEEAYNKGYVLARNNSTNHFFKRGEVRTQWSFVKADTVVSPRGQQVLNKIPGYVPKQRTNAYYFVKSEKAGVLSGAGKDFKVGTTVAWSDTPKGADDWIAAQDDPSKFIKVFDRELTPGQQMQEISATHGGMYSGARKTVELPFVGDEAAEFADSFEAMQHYINHIGRQYPAALYRLGSEQRLVSIAEGVGVKGATGLHNVLGQAIASGIRKDSKEYKMLEDIHDQVSFVNMIPTEGELAWSKRFEAIGNAAEIPLLKKLPGWSKVPKFFYSKASASTHPADLIRGFTFNHLLGMYNPAQILVQFSGAIVSAAIAPIHTIKVMPKALVGWPMLDLSMGDPKAQARILKYMRANKMEEFADDYELWQQSGYRESVINGNADYTSLFMKNLPYDAGVASKALANHTVFYKMGELANTRTAFAVAIERYKTANKVARIDPKDAKALEIIGKDAEVLRLNMSRANQSDLNKGWKSVPFQFQQVISKYFEKVLPPFAGGTDELNGYEKFRLAAIPTALTGLGGVPLGQTVSIELLKLAGIDETDLSPGQTQMAKFGAIGYTLNEGLNFNTDLSSRMSLGGDILQKAYEVFTGQSNIFSWLGPTGGVVDRYYRNMQYIGEAFDLSTVKNEDINIDSLRFMGSVLVDAAIDIPSVSRNFKQYSRYFLTQNPQFIKDGKYIFDFETMNKRTALMGVFGFQPQEIGELYQLDREINSDKVAFSKFGDMEADVILRVLNTHILGEGVSVEHQALGAQMVNSILIKYGPMEAAELMNSVFQKANNKRFDQNDMLIKFLMESEKKMQDGLDFYSVPMARKLEAMKEGE